MELKTKTYAFSKSEANLDTLLYFLHYNKKEIEDNNAYIYVSEKFLRELMEDFTYLKYVHTNDTVTFDGYKDKNDTNLYNCEIHLSLVKDSNIRMLRITDLKTNKPLCENDFYKPNEANDLGAIFIKTKLENINKNIKRR